jgi:hypothetical protein
MNQEDKIRIDISGGHWMEREMLGDLISGGLKNVGFNDVKATNAAGVMLPDSAIAHHTSSTILDAVVRMRPDLMDKEILVAAAPNEQFVNPYEKMGTSTAEPDRFSKWGDYEKIPGVQTVIRDGVPPKGGIVDMRYGDTPGKCVETVLSIGAEPKHIGIRANDIPSAVQAVRQALRATGDAYVTVSLRREYEDPLHTSNAVYFNDPPEKDINPLPLPLGQLASVADRAKAVANRASNETGLLSQQIVNELITSQGFQDLVEDITRDMIDERVRDADRNLCRYVDDMERRVMKQLTVEPEVMQQLEDIVATARELNGKPPLTDAGDKNTAESDYVPPKEDEPKPTSPKKRK